ncbi:hypothetical protein M0P65_00370 [Candidatus Gracilibacteria bacterium]|nr:hypothetical protein [Candidatus Gracilibacteria bacterium]
MRTLIKQFFSKISNGIYFGIGLILTLGIFGLVYAALSWIPQTTVGTGSGLTATAWNDMINNIGYLKENVDAKLATNGNGSALTGLTKTQVGLGNVDNTSDVTKNVLSATKLTTARTINGVSFNGTANIIIPPCTKIPLYSKLDTYKSIFNCTGTPTQSITITTSCAAVYNTYCGGYRSTTCTVLGYLCQ